MSKFGRLNEFTEDELEAELAVRRRRRVQGACDYCGKPPESTACKFPERHAQTLTRSPIAIDTIVCDLCDGVESTSDLPCLKCGGKREVVDHLAVAFERALLAVFGEREKEFSSTLRRRLRSLWGAPLELKGIKSLIAPGRETRSEWGFKVEKHREGIPGDFLLHFPTGRLEEKRTDSNSWVTTPGDLLPHPIGRPKDKRADLNPWEITLDGFLPNPKEELANFNFWTGLDLAGGHTTSRRLLQELHGQFVPNEQPLTRDTPHSPGSRHSTHQNTAVVEPTSETPHAPKHTPRRRPSASGLRR